MENKEIMELAAQLGDALKNDERLVRLENAKKAYENDPELRKYMVEYESSMMSKNQNKQKTEEEKWKNKEIPKPSKRIEELSKKKVMFEATKEEEVPTFKHRKPKDLPEYLKEFVSVKNYNCK